MLERFSFFLAHFPVFMEHNSHGDPEKVARYDVGLRRLRLLRRIAEPFAWGPPERARELGEQVYAFLHRLLMIHNPLICRIRFGSNILQDRLLSVQE